MKMRKIGGSNLSAITDEKGDLLFDRDSPINPGSRQPDGFVPTHVEIRRTGIWITGAMLFFGKMAVFIGSIVLILGLITGRLPLNTLFPEKNTAEEMASPVLKAQELPNSEKTQVQTENLPDDQLKISNVIVARGIEESLGLKDNDNRLHCCMDFEGAVPGQTQVRVDWYKGGERIREGLNETFQAASGRTCSSLKDNLIEGFYEAKIIANNLNIEKVSFRIMNESNRQPYVAIKNDYKPKNGNSDGMNIPKSIRSPQQQSMHSYRPPATLNVQREDHNSITGYSVRTAKKLTSDGTEAGDSKTVYEEWEKARYLATYEDR